MTAETMDDLDIRTHEAMMNPQVGDRFHEFFHHWVYVVKVTPCYVWTMSASAPCEFPKDGKLERRTKKAFIEFYSYKSPNLPDRYWINLCDRGADAAG